MQRIAHGEYRGDHALAELGRELRGNGMYALVGAGLSVSSGLPAWEALLDELLPTPKAVEAQEVDAIRLVDRGDLRIRDELVRKDLPWRAQLIEEQLKRQPLRQKLNARFMLEKPVFSEAVAAVIRLPFQHILTTNYDNVLDSAHRELLKMEPQVLCWHSMQDRSTFVNAIGKASAPGSSRYYVHLHGTASTPDSCVFTEEDYRETYVRSHSLSRNLYALFATQTVTFIGFSLSDPDFVAILREVQALGGGLPRHYAILPKPPDGDGGLVAYLLGKYGVRPILYPNRTGRHEGLTPLLTNLMDLTQHGKDWAYVDLEAKRSDGQQNASDDPNAGHFGGSPQRDGFTVELASFTCWDDKWITLKFRVTLNGGPPMTQVAFYLHPTFPDVVVRVDPADGECTLNLHAWGAFTLGVVVKDTRTRLELDLQKETRLPAAFRAR